MSSILFVSLVMCTVAVFGFQRGGLDSRRELEKEIKSTEIEILNLQKDSQELRRQCHDANLQFASIIKEEESLRYKGAHRNKLQLQYLEELFRQYRNITIEEESVTTSVEDIKKFKLYIEVIKDNVNKLNERRASGMTKSCLILHKMAKNSTQSATPSVLASGFNYGNMVLRQKLSLLLADKLVETNTRDGLRKKLRNLWQSFKETNTALKQQIELIGSDYLKGEEAIAKMKKAIEEKKHEVSAHIKAAEDLKKEFDCWRREAKKASDKYKLYATDVVCYQQLFNDVNVLIVPTPKSHF